LVGLGPSAEMSAAKSAAISVAVTRAVRACLPLTGLRKIKRRPALCGHHRSACQHS
jgi:hypothetical protein